VALDHLANRVLVGHVRSEILYLVPLLAELVPGALDPLRLASGDRQSEAFLAQHLGQGIADSPGSSSDDGGTIGHCEPFFGDIESRNLTTAVRMTRNAGTRRQAGLGGA
jgi:hypothetical protein